jgi:CYTH domain-containing protein
MHADMVAIVAPSLSFDDASNLYTCVVISRRPGEGRYAQLEREQRWLLRALPPEVTDERAIVDHYWTGTSLRLRMIQDRDDVLYKLCQKVRLDSGNPEFVKITNIYLSSAEFHALSITPSSIISKSRWSATLEGVNYAVDEFKGRHTGLVLAERELRGDEPRSRGPQVAVAEVTNKNEYSGGWLATASVHDLRHVIARASDK